MKKILSAGAAVLLVCCLFSDCKKSEKSKELVNGHLAFMNSENGKDVFSVEDKEPGEFKGFDSLNLLTLALISGKIDRIYVPGCTADYLSNRIENLEVKTLSNVQTSFSMIAPAENAELVRMLDAGIISMKQDGLLAKLAYTKSQKGEYERFYIDGVIKGKDIDSVRLPHYEGAKTYTVAVTGDIPPLDYIDAAGKPNGFNMALLSELSMRLNVNFNVINIESGARVAALSSGKADVVFWCADYIFDQAKKYEELHDAESDEAVILVSQKIAEELSENGAADVPKGMLVTIPYYTTDMKIVSLKKLEG